MSSLRSVRVDPDARTARIEAGALLGDLDQETSTFGLATPTGIDSTTGIAGLTLGGGFGWLTRRYGMAIDSLPSVDLVTADGVGPVWCVDWQRAFDPLVEHGARNYWKTHDMPDLTDEVVDVLLRVARDLPTDETEPFVGQVGGAAGRVPADATAYPHRDAAFVSNVHGRWRDPGRDDAVIAWVRDLYDAMAPHALSGADVSFVSEREGAETTAYGTNDDRLVALKDEWGLDSLFRTNRNVRPSAAVADDRPRVPVTASRAAPSRPASVGRPPTRRAVRTPRTARPRRVRRTGGTAGTTRPRWSRPP
jgi:hypothetical protein